MHPAVRNLIKWLTPNPNLPDTQQRISQGVHDLAVECEPMCEGPELAAGLRKLLEAKDCLVRASLEKEAHDHELVKDGGS